LSKKWLKLTVRVLLTGVLFGFCFLWGKKEVLYPQYLSEPRFILDAGHGGEDGGAVSCTGRKESEINLEITLCLNEILAFLGEDTLLLRNTDISLHDSESTTLREKKISDLKNRADFVKQNPFSTLVSIHQNTFSDSKYRGTQIFYAATADSQNLAENIQGAVKQRLQPDNTRQAKPIDKHVYLLNHIDNRAVLVECGFLSNPKDNALLQQKRYQQKFALVLGTTLTDIAL